MANKLIKTLIKYLATFSVALLVLIGYFEISTYPYKVARWVQPIEARFSVLVSKRCSGDSSWLSGMIDYAVINQGGYSAQAVYIDANQKISACEAGFKNYYFGEVVGGNDRYRYASVTKLITAAAIKNLIVQKKIALNDPLVAFFPELGSFKDKRIVNITIADLLNHTAGFSRLTAQGDPMFLRKGDPWCPGHLERLQTLKLDFDPGKKQVYSNLGFCLLGEVMHRVTGQNFRQYLNDAYLLPQQNILFISNYFYKDEVAYDYRYEKWYSDSYLKLFDFDAVAPAAGLSGSAKALAGLLWDIEHKQKPSPYKMLVQGVNCKLSVSEGCLQLGAFHYQQEKNGLMLNYHQGYLPGSRTIAVVDSFGGVTVVTKSGADKLQGKPEGEWIAWIYKRLSLYYTLQGKLPILESFTIPLQ